MIIGRTTSLCIFLAFFIAEIQVTDAKCSDDQFECLTDGKCIRAAQYCNFVYDCSDNSDEIVYNVTLHNETGVSCTRESNYVCLLPNDQSHKKNKICRRNSCDDDEFECKSNEKCVSAYGFCNGGSVCRDGSDDEIYNESLHAGLGIPCLSRAFANRLCVLPNDQAYKNRSLCKKDAGCGNYMYKCGNSGECIPPYSFCDGHNRCGDWSDETDYFNVSDKERFIPCRHRNDPTKFCALPRNLGESTEFICRKSGKCLYNEYRCLRSKKCINRRDFCDRKRHCVDYTDEYIYKSERHSRYGIPCKHRGYLNHVCLLPNSQAWKKNYLCKSEPSCDGDVFRCRRTRLSSTCIFLDLFCNGQDDCWDGSDETPLDNTSLLGRRCGVKDTERACLLPEYHLCDGIEHCADGVDEAFCRNGTEMKQVFSDDVHFRCLDQSSVIPNRQQCDGIFHCEDLSDECLCISSQTPQLLSRICSAVLHPRFSEDNSSCLTLEKICNGRIDCEDGSDEMFCEKKGGVCSDEPAATNKCDFTCKDGTRAKQCDGRGTCRYSLFEEECSRKCEHKPVFCDRVSFLPLFSGYNKYICEGILALPCDGIVECPDLSDELNCKNRFYCVEGSPEHIGLEDVCDLKKDCNNGADELHCQNHTKCSNTEMNGTSICSFTHFYCDNETYIDYQKVYNGEADCVSGIDECQNKTRTFSDDRNMIKYKQMLPFIWAIGLAAFFGNSFLFTTTLRSIITNWKKMSVVQKSHSIVLLNLSLGDFLVGAYTLSICILNEVLSKGTYCLRDQEWRSGKSCSALGALVMTGSEQSVFMLIIITAVRLRSVLRPFEKQSIRLLFGISVLAWVISVSLAVFPLFAFAENYFTEKIWYSQNSFLSYVYQSQVPVYSQRLLKYFNRSSSAMNLKDWNQLKNLIQTLNPEYIPARGFGYYSKHSVCLPRLFPDPINDETWGYTFTIILINFLSFFFIFIGYFLIYIKSTNPNVRRSSNAENTVKLQRKVTMIVITDMLCWVPIAIIGLLTMLGVEISPSLYAGIGVILIPINSAINPFLYSDLPKIIWGKIVKCKNGFSTRHQPTREA